MLRKSKPLAPTLQGSPSLQTGSSLPLPGAGKVSSSSGSEYIKPDPNSSRKGVTGEEYSFPDALLKSKLDIELPGVKMLETVEKVEAAVPEPLLVLLPALEEAGVMGY